MTPCLLADEVNEFVTQLFVEEAIDGTEEWKNLMPIEFGILSWHLGNFYVCPLPPNLERTACFACYSGQNGSEATAC